MMQTELPERGFTGCNQYKKSGSGSSVNSYEKGQLSLQPASSQQPATILLPETLAGPFTLSVSPDDRLSVAGVTGR